VEKSLQSSPELRIFVLKPRISHCIVVAGVALASQSAHDEYGYRTGKSSGRDECLVALF